MTNTFTLAVSVGQIPHGKGHLSPVVVVIIAIAVIALLIVSIQLFARRR
jgi:hypothetical protein